MYRYATGSRVTSRFLIGLWSRTKQTQVVANPGTAFQKLKWQPRLSADNRRYWELITERCDGFAVADRCNPHLRLSAGIARFSQLLVSQYMAIADTGHPLRSREMASMRASGALGLDLGINVQYGTRCLPPR